ncbi:conserved Plasmodium protein, unknown function [Plasmodium reichenowi]|uniref:Uncharacterized protein n=1 Tax=Plasmodium reichenowi TaxID=5854 RepID=A0A060RWH0_PLARE|nr:conserved Plasmodium protein, unknown function [Plasmodium reichenowi]SOV78407.1 conserved Plasmodium protein, unknown function [Plasmodium reichenowi]
MKQGLCKRLTLLVSLNILIFIMVNSNFCSFGFIINRNEVMKGTSIIIDNMKKKQRREKRNNFGCVNCFILRNNKIRWEKKEEKNKKINMKRIYLFDRSVDKVSGHFLQDRGLFIEADKKMKIIEEIEKMTKLEYKNVEKYLNVLSENDVYEEVINHKFYMYKKNNEKEKHDKLIKIQEFLNPFIINLRKKKAKEKVEYLIACIIKGVNIDEVITEMFKRKIIDIYVLTFIDDKIIEAHTKLLKDEKLNNKDEQMSISEKILRTLKDRIIAQQKLNKKGTFVFTRLLFLSSTLNINEDRKSMIKSMINTIEQLEEFELYLLDALEYAHENDKLQKYIPHMELLLNACKQVNPVYNQTLNKQSENIGFFPESVDPSNLKNF